MPVRSWLACGSLHFLSPKLHGFAFTASICMPEEVEQQKRAALKSESSCINSRKRHANVNRGLAKANQHNLNWKSVNRPGKDINSNWLRSLSGNYRLALLGEDCKLIAKLVGSTTCRNKQIGLITIHLLYACLRDRRRW